MNKRLLSFILLLSILTMGRAQEMSVRAPNTVVTGQRFKVTFEVNGKAHDFRGPSFKGFSTLSGPSQSSSSSWSSINGKVTSSTSTSFSYLIQADVEGNFTIGAASCQADGKQISSAPFTIKVEKGNPQQQQQQQNNGYGGYGRQQQAQQQQPTTLDGRTLFARASINKNNPYQGEQIIITYKIYTQVPISQFQIEKLPGNKGFWAEDLSENRREVKQWEETVDGRHYQVAEIRRGALFAQENGTLHIEPLNLDVLAMVQRQRQRTGTIWDLFDDPFFNSAQAVEKSLSTNALNVNVKKLPTAPEGYTGGVGHFDATSKVDNTSIKANEAITYTLTISGSGNLMLINAPEIDFPSVFEAYEPEVSDKINKNDNGISGSRTFQWVLIPRSQGEYEIPAHNFVYFDPATGHYVTKTLPAQKIKVAKGDPNAMKSVTSKSDVKLLNHDINYIKSNGNFKSNAEARTPWWFWLALGLILLGTLLTITIGRKRQVAQQDVANVRLKRATRLAQKRLKQAAQFLRSGDDNRFYEEIYKAIWGCLADKFNIPLSSLNRDTVQSCLDDKGVAEDQKQEIMETLQDVDFARFAPGDSSTKKQNIYDKSLQMIRKLSFVIIFIVASLGVMAQTPQQLFASGNEAYKSEQYQQAAQYYEEALAQGVVSSSLYYNLGNAYYRTGDMASAVLNYERAHRLAPGDRDIRENLLLAESHCQDKIAQLPQLFVKRWWNALVGLFSTQAWHVALLIFLILACAAFVVFMLSSLYNTRKWSLVSCGVFTLLLLISIATTVQSTHDSDSHKDAIVMNAMVAVKSSPEQKSVDKFILHEGTKVHIEDQIGNWLQIRIGDGSRGWLEDSAIERI